jgi:hypothetical protein
MEAKLQSFVTLWLDGVRSVNLSPDCCSPAEGTRYPLHRWQHLPEESKIFRLCRISNCVPWSPQPCHYTAWVIYARFGDCVSSVTDCQIWGFNHRFADWPTLKQHNCVSQKTREVNSFLVFLKTSFSFFYQVLSLKPLPTVTERPQIIIVAKYRSINLL